ncbi:hypothetical protein [Clostridium kluyveri]|uniref:hypothetical protein n=1 Tax=Clostridium kluyveri TaxID=1534 RepID=UPI002247BCB3|nr:hypothetical protein [Clostridium kluyveri]UZQ49969.1 hypothetical protein OP486_18775 [Clostridium kluyveri]
MNISCNDVHSFFNRMKRFYFPYDPSEIPQNGIYVLFEQGEKAHNGDRIVRIGTHTGNNQLQSRLKQHFINENKDRSIFRKNIGRCILDKRKDEYLKIWELDLTTRQRKTNYLHLIDKDYQQKIEREVSKYIQSNFSFCVIPLEKKEKRLKFESKLISTISLCKDCYASENWLGLNSTKKKIRESGLWLVNELYKEPLLKSEFAELVKNIKN